MRWYARGTCGVGTLCVRHAYEYVDPLPGRWRCWLRGAADGAPLTARSNGNPRCCTGAALRLAATALRLPCCVRGCVLLGLMGSEHQGIGVPWGQCGGRAPDARRWPRARRLVPSGSIRPHHTSHIHNGSATQCRCCSAYCVRKPGLISDGLAGDSQPGPCKACPRAGPWALVHGVCEQGPRSGPPYRTTSQQTTCCHYWHRGT